MKRGTKSARKLSVILVMAILFSLILGTNGLALGSGYGDSRTTGGAGATSQGEGEKELLELQPRMFYIYDSFGYIDNQLTGSKPALGDEQEGVLAAPPYSENPYIPPIDEEAAVNPNTWRTAGAKWTESERTNEVNLLRQCRIDELWFFDGPVYAPATYIVDGSAPYEVMGGELQIFINDEMVFSYAATNEGVWVKVDLDGVITDTVKFVKIQDDSPDSDFRYSWADPGWSSPPKEYVCDVNIVEIALYGESLGDIPPEDPEEEWTGFTPSDEDPTDFDITMGGFIGTNGFFNDVADNNEAIGFVREYHNWRWTEYTASESSGGAVRAEPNAAFRDPWNGVFDDYYKKMKEMGVEVSICIQGGVDDSIIPEGMTSRPNYQGDTNKYKAESYLAHGQSMFQHAARYGSNKDLDPSLVRVGPGTDKKIGLGYVQYYENWNEPNLATFKGDGGAFAAMMSADYDGHMMSMGPDVGVKQADPNAKLVMGGLAGYIYKIDEGHEKGSTQNEFFEQMIEWFDKNRTEEQWIEINGNLDGYVKYPFDVINGHAYTTDSSAHTGKSPEDYDLLIQMGKFREIRDMYFPDKEIWLSEFGWDSAMGSPHSATVEYEDPVKGVVNEGINTGLTGQEVQGRWLIREYLILAAAGLDRVQQYMMPNTVEVEDENSGRYATCGLIEGLQSSTKRKPSWYYVATMKHHLDTTKFDSIIEDGGETDPWVLKFRETQGEEGDSVYALWLPTSKGDMDGENFESYTLTLPEDSEYAYVVNLVDKKKRGITEPINIIDGKVTVDIGEKPIFVIAKKSKLNIIPESEKLELRPEMALKLMPHWSDPGTLFDEQTMDPLNNREDSPELKGPAGDANNFVYGRWAPPTPGWTLVDLGGKYKITDIFLYDAHSMVDEDNGFEIHYGSLGDWDIGPPESQTADSVAAQLATSNWTLGLKYRFDSYLAWHSEKVDIETRYLILGFPGNQGVAIPEMILYGYKVEEEEPGPVDKEALVSAISDAEDILAEADIGIEPGQHPQEAADALDTAIDVARAVLLDENATQGEVNGAVATLNEAVGIFLNAINPGDEEPEIGSLEISGVPSIVEVGEEIEVTITAKQAVNLAGIDLRLGYDEGLFELKEVILNENFDLDLEDFNYEVKDGVIRLINLILCDGSGYTGDIDMVKLVMKAKDKDALTSISILEGSNLSDINAGLYTVEESIEEVLAIADSDITGDGTAINDLVLIAKAFGLSQGDVAYDPRLDMNKDGIIDIVDIAYVSGRILKG